MTLIENIINNMYEKEKIVKELINIDNDKMLKNITFDDYIKSLKALSSTNTHNIPFNRDTLFITEGNPLLTIDILRYLDSNYNYIIFINQGYIAMNKWLINEYHNITGNNNVELDTNINYNDYIELNYQVIPIGEDSLTNQVLEDFYEK